MFPDDTDFSQTVTHWVEDGTQLYLSSTLEKKVGMYHNGWTIWQAFGWEVLDPEQGDEETPWYTWYEYLGLGAMFYTNHYIEVVDEDCQVDNGDLVDNPLECPWTFVEDMWNVEDASMTFVAKRNLTETYQLKIGGSYYMEGGYQVVDPEGTEVGMNFIENLELIIIEDSAKKVGLYALSSIFALFSYF